MTYIFGGVGSEPTDEELSVVLRLLLAIVVSGAVGIHVLNFLH